MNTEVRGRKSAVRWICLLTCVLCPLISSLAIEELATDAQGNQLPLKAKPATPGATPYPLNFRPDVKLDGTNLLQRIEDASAGGGGGGVTLPAAALRGIDKEVYIAFRTDSVPGTGTKEDPFDGSTQANFDALMVAIPTNTHIHIGVGTFTAGQTTLKEGWWVEGEGKYLTIIKFPDNYFSTNTLSNYKSVFEHYDWRGALEYCRVSNLTTDCNAANQPTVTNSWLGHLNSVSIYGRKIIIENVQGLGIYSNGSEGFPLGVLHPSSSDPSDYIYIEGCDVINPITSAAGGMTAIRTSTHYKTRVSGAVGATTNASTTLTTTADFFTATDAGRVITATGIPTLPVSTTIATYTNARTVILSQAATATASSLIITLPQASVKQRIARCRVISAVPSTYIVAYGSGAAGPHPTQIIDNYSWGVGHGLLYDTGNFNNITISRNEFMNCGSGGSGGAAIVIGVTPGVGTTTEDPTNITLSNNILETIGGYSGTVNLKSGAFNITGNTIINRNNFGRAFSLTGPTTGEVSGNIIDEEVASDLSTAPGLNAHNNHDPTGKFNPLGKPYVSAGAPVYFKAAPYASVDTSSGDVVVSTAATGTVGAALSPGQKFRIYNDGGVALGSSINSPGAGKFRMQFGGLISGSLNTADALAESTFVPTTNARKAMVIKAITGQTANLLEIKNSTSVIGTSFGPDGKIAGDLSNGTMNVTSITGVRQPIASATYTVLASDYLIAFTATFTNQTATLPAGAANATYIFTDESNTAATNNKTIATTGGQLIDGAATASLISNGGTIRLYWTGTGWHVAGGDRPAALLNTTLNSYNSGTYHVDRYTDPTGAANSRIIDSVFATGAWYLRLLNDDLSIKAVPITAHPARVIIGTPLNVGATNGTDISRIRHGTVALTAGIATVSDTNVTANTRIWPQRQTDGGTIGCSYSITRTAATSFTITAKDSGGATQTADTSTLAYEMIEP